MFYFIALAGAHKRVVEQLREQLVMVRFDPLFCTPKVFFVVSVIRLAKEQHFSQSSGYLVFAQAVKNVLQITQEKQLKHYGIS